MKVYSNDNFRIVSLFALPILFALGTTPILLLTSTWEEWLIVDYLVRVLILLYILMIPIVRSEVRRMFWRPWPESIGQLRAMTFFAVVLGTLVLEIFINQLRPPLTALFPEMEFFNYFEIQNRFWLIFDLTIGLVLVAVSEEIVFRGFVVRVLQVMTRRPIFLVLMSALIFGVAHWPNGVDNIVATGLTGIVLGGIYMWSKSLWPCVIIHYLINLGYFWPS